MVLSSLWQTVADSPIGAYIAASQWAFPTFETLHVIAIVTVFGTIAVMDMRMIGLASRDVPLTDMSRDTLPITWMAFVLAAITGTLLWTSKATYYMVNPWFLTKMVLIIIAGLNMMGFHFLTWKHVREFDTARTIPTKVKVAGIVSLTLWIIVICCGRMIGFTLDKYLPPM